MSRAVACARCASAKVYRRGLFDRTPAFQLRVDRSFERAGDRRRHGAERRGQDHAVRNDRRLAMCRPAGASWWPDRTSSACATPSATGWRSIITSPIRCAHFRKTKAVLHAWSARRSDYPLVHLFDEPQFNTQDGYIGFMLDFFRRLRSRATGWCSSASTRRRQYQLNILKEICERFLFVNKGGLDPTIRPSLSSPGSRTCASISAHSRIKSPVSSAS